MRFVGFGDIGSVNRSLDDIVDLLLADKTESVESKVVKLVVLVEDKNDLVVSRGPNTVYELVLFLKDRVNEIGAAVSGGLVGKELLPECESHHRTHHAGVHHARVNRVKTRAAEVGAAGCNAEHILGEHLGHDLCRVGFDYLSVNVFGVDWDVKIVGILNARNRAAKLGARILELVFNKALKCLEVVLAGGYLLESGYELGDLGILVDRIVAMVSLAFGEEGLHKCGDVRRLVLYRDRIGGERRFLNVINVSRHTLGNRKNKRDTDDTY